MQGGCGAETERRQLWVSPRGMKSDQLSSAKDPPSRSGRLSYSGADRLLGGLQESLVFLRTWGRVLGPEKVLVSGRARDVGVRSS